MKKYLKMPWAVRLAALFAMIPALFLGGCGQQTKCEKSIDTAMGTVISQTVYVTGNSPTATNGKTDEKVTDVYANIPFSAFEKGYVIIKKGKKVFHKAVL